MGIGILPNVNSQKKKNRDVKPGISVCSHITRLMNNQTKAKERPLFTEKKRKRRQECGGYCENCATIELRLARLGSIGFSKRKTVPVKPDAKSPGTVSKNTVRSVYATSRKHPGKERTIAWKNTSQPPTSAKSLRCEM